MKVLIDNGHGENTPGKRSPDGRLREWAYTREIADLVVAGLRKKGIDAERIVKEDSDVPLSERCRRANNIYRDTGKKAILVSIHCNAAGNGISWKNAQGWSAFASNNASLNSKRLAESLAQVAECIPVPVRKPMPQQPYWEQNLAICRDTNCPAVLTENFFQDSKEDVEYLLSPEGKDTVARIHIEGILKYLGL
ncbi:N-acetylmuramoyl-L-alanine amidase [Bacteroides thetaiotaomicron]|uniref:N-acetylmuramoyl-L-alanine amidase n=1 Tax=Bacteroides thetaiotaomicron TaxID=818 RepID=UPI000E4FA4B8|nr:N-acetylmuramoyl-L-alanine amidase [Bacteroides thetaiotaomicron]RGR93979.1 N-acetylmuramoyl-L-alanine amidase [Bacteroides thetaiotaomicron]